MFLMDSEKSKNSGKPKNSSGKRVSFAVGTNEDKSKPVQSGGKRSLSSTQPATEDDNTKKKSSKR
ncbi:hypothetical protein BELL_0495g00100 [Botrytis elliptica]|uniref:Uncharacterized protein n=1 Tax=Botrytis elliptica TaxID=278938 RepID=A0A4Z1JS60_9HELO|nr:hypothetical protein BELL_0495g00100 [Botrytis elliptica]